MKTRLQVKNSIWIAVLVIGIFVIGMFLGTKMVPQPTVKETTTITRYEPWPYPVEVVVEKEKLVPTHSETPDPEIIEKYKDVDSAAIIQMFLAKNHYDLDFSKDSIGKFIAHVDVQGNEIIGAAATIQPLTKIVETTSLVERPKRFIGGYAMIGSSIDFQTAKVSAGVEFRERYVLGVSGMKINNDWGYTLDIGIKF